MELHMLIVSLGLNTGGPPKHSICVIFAVGYLKVNSVFKEDLFFQSALLTAQKPAPSYFSSVQIYGSHFSIFFVSS